MAKIAILTDSTAGLPMDTRDKYNIHSIPLIINWDKYMYKDGIDITTQDFYSRLEKSTNLPTTSQPSVVEFLNLFENLSASYDYILAPLLSSGISGTVSAALSAASEFNKIPVEIIDSRTTASGFAILVLALAKAIQQGISFMEVKSLALEIIQKQSIYFVVDSLKYLHKGGRIGGASRFLGSALNIKPILYMNQAGKIDGLERVRTKRKALERMIDLIEEQAKGEEIVAGILQANVLEEAVELKNKLSNRLKCKEISIFELSPVIGVHVGSGTLGIGIF